MIAALDVHYDQRRSVGTAAAVLFANWDDAVPAAEFTEVVERIQPYIPGEFFRREFPCLFALVNKIQEPLEAIVIDGYVRLGNKPGLGQHLFEQLINSQMLRLPGVPDFGNEMFDFGGRGMILRL